MARTDVRAIGIWGALLASALLSCSGGSAPSAPAPQPTLALPAPTPTPVAPIPGYSALCSSMGYAPTGASCEEAASEYLGWVEEAIDQTIAEHPGWFNLKYELGYQGYKVYDPDSYLDAVVAKVASRGVCASMDPRREYLKVKRDTAMAETFEILHPQSFVRRRYLQTCRPADFPVRPEDVIHYIRVAFYGFRCPPNVSRPPAPLGLLPLGCEGLATATPKDLAGKDVPASIHGPDITWELSQGEDVVAVLPNGDQDFNRAVRPLKLGKFGLCATVRGVSGCLDGKVINDW